MVAFSKGIIAASDKGLFGVWIKNEDPNNNNNRQEDDFNFAFLRDFESERQIGVVSMDINQREDMMVIAFKNNDVATVDLTKIVP